MLVSTGIWTLTALLPRGFESSHTLSFVPRPPAAATNVLKYGSGRLHRIMLNDPNTAGVVTIYDNTAATGTIIATVTIPSPGTQSKPIPSFLDFDCPFHIGLTIVTSTTTNVTVIYE